MNDIVINKIQSMQRCVTRAREELRAAGDNFARDYTRQDATVLNITRACEQAIDLANHVIKSQKMGVPVSTADSFALLARQSVISSDLEQKLVGMTGFRNIAVHQYQELNLDIVVKVVQEGLDDLVMFGDLILKAMNDD